MNMNLQQLFVNNFYILVRIEEFYKDQQMKKVSETCWIIGYISICFLRCRGQRDFGLWRQGQLPDGHYAAQRDVGGARNQIGKSG